MSHVSTQNTRPNRTRIYLFVLAATLLLAGGGWLVYRQLYNSSQASLKVQKQQARAADNQKKSNVNDGKAAGDDSSTSGNDNYVPPSSADNITLTTSEANDQVTLITKLDGYSDGSCKLTTTNGTHTDTRTAQVIFQSQFSTCAGFSIPVSTLGTGTWNFSLAVTSGGITTTKTASLDVK